MEPQYNYSENYDKKSKNEKIDQDAFIDNNVVEEDIGILRKLWIKWDIYVYTVCILLNYINFGLVSTLGSPAMVDLKFLFRTTMVKLNYGSTISTFGYLAGSLCGFLYKFVNRQLVLILVTVVNGIFFAIQPLSQNVYQYYIFTGTSAFGGGAWDSGNFVWIFEMWKERAPSILNLQQMMYGVGTIIGPLLISPYLVGDLSLSTTDMTSATESTTLTTISTQKNIITGSNSTNDEDINYSVDRRSKLMVPFMIGGSLMLTMPIVFLVMFFIKRYKIPEKQTEVNSQTVVDSNSNEEQTRVGPRTRLWLILLFALSLSAYNATETTFIMYVATYCQYLPIKIPAPTAAKLQSIMSGTYTFGRGASALISIKLSPQIMLSYHLVIIVISLVTLYFGQNSLTLVYIGISIIGFGFSAVFPTYFSFAEKTIKLTDRVNSIFFFSSTLFLLFVPFIIAPFIEKHPKVLLFLEFGLFAIVLSLFIVIVIVVRIAKRYPINQQIKS